MKLTKINYVSAVFVGVSVIVMYVIMAILQLILAQYDPLVAVMVAQVGRMTLLVYTPIIGGVVAYLFTLVMILVYNVVAKKYPVSWQINK